MPYRTFCQFPQFQFSAVKLQKKLILQTFLGKNIFKTYIFSLKVRDFFLLKTAILSGIAMLSSTYSTRKK